MPGGKACEEAASQWQSPGVRARTPGTHQQGARRRLQSGRNAVDAAIRPMPSAACCFRGTGKASLGRAGVQVPAEPFGPLKHRLQTFPQAFAIVRLDLAHG